MLRRILNVFSRIRQLKNTIGSRRNRKRNVQRKLLNGKLEFKMLWDAWQKLSARRILNSRELKNDDSCNKLQRKIGKQKKKKSRKSNKLTREILK